MAEGARCRTLTATTTVVVILRTGAAAVAEWCATLTTGGHPRYVPTAASRYTCTGPDRTPTSDTSSPVGCRGPNRRAWGRSTGFSWPPGGNCTLARRRGVGRIAEWGQLAGLALACSRYNCTDWCQLATFNPHVRGADPEAVIDDRDAPPQPARAWGRPCGILRTRPLWSPGPLRPPATNETARPSTIVDVTRVTDGCRINGTQRPATPQNTRQDRPKRPSGDRPRRSP